MHQKYKETEEDVLEQDQKLIVLDNKSQILSRELERTSTIYETIAERQPTLNNTCAIVSAFLTYLDPYTDGFQRPISKHDVVMSIEQSFLSGSKIYIRNCNTLDNLLYPLAQWKATSHELNSNDDSNLIIYCGRHFDFYTTCESPDKDHFFIDITYSLFDQFIPLNDKKPSEDTKYPQLPSLIETNELKKEELSAPDQKQIDEDLKKLIRSFNKIILSFDRDGKSEILQLEFLATSLPTIDIQFLSYPSTLTKKPN
ncbi:unnamed protein product [Adineta steineri]|uniref:Uncharacterized protein n=1 Tax=Adineta steineri TaxID=433720 RepID=A0A819EF73_9BILA|nr:unnamed protein product [Adineta steineri]